MKNIKLIIIMVLCLILPINTFALNENNNKNEYEISYDLKKGIQNSNNPDNYIVGDNIELSAPTRKGYTFTGWYLVSEPKTKITNIENQTGDIALYASWVANRYNVKYDGNGSTSGTTENQTKLKYGITYELSENAFQRKGYTFIGWNTKSDGTGISLNDSDTIKNLSTKNGKTVILYAQWKANKYEISYDLKKGTQISNNPSEYTIKDSIELSAPTRKGYTFTGWYLVSEPKTKITNIENQTGDIALYASWVANRYNVKYDGNGSTSGTTENQTKLKYGITYELSENAFQRKGYTFIGWNTKSDGTGISLNDSDTIKNLSTKNGKTVILYAQWKANKYKVNFVYNEIPQMESVTYKYGKNYYLPKNVYQKDNYVFAGWNTKINGSGTTYKDGQKVKNLTSKNNAEVNLYPVWIPRKPNISNIKNIDYRSLKITLDLPENSEGYFVYRANKYDGKYVKVATILNSSESFEDTNLTSRKTYYYKIRSFETNEYGVRIYSDYSDVYVHTTAEKPNFMAYITNYSLNDWYFVNIDVENYGTKDIIFHSIANFYPYDGAAYTTSEIYGENYVPSGRQKEISYYLENRRYFYDDSFIFTSFTYDDCIYFVKIYKTERAIFY